MSNTVEVYDMPDGTTVYLNALPNFITDPKTGKTWYADLELTRQGARETRKIGKRRL